MRQSTNRSDRRFARGIALPAIAALAMAAGAAYAVVWALQAPVRPAAVTARATAAPARAGEMANLAPVLRADGAPQYQNVVLMADGKPITLRLEFEPPRSASLEPRITWRCDRGRLESNEGATENRFTPPAKSEVATVEAEVSFYPKSLDKKPAGAAMTRSASLKIISPTPGSMLRNGVLDGFKIGQYLDPRTTKPKKGHPPSYANLYPDRFLKPDSFYLVDDASRDLRVSEHLRLGDYALDYPWFSLGKRQYIALDYSLVRKYEDLIADLNRAGLQGDKLVLIYGFRSPDYNDSRIEQDGGKTLKALFSMHQYGRAMDLILDADGDLKMDDLDGDGRITVRDAAVLMHYVNILDRRYRDQKTPLYGGAGLYDHHDFWERPVQSPYVHIDTRAFLSGEGNLVRWPGEWPDTRQPIEWGKI
jgi:hypothetical protein